MIDGCVIEVVVALAVVFALLSVFVKVTGATQRALPCLDESSADEGSAPKKCSQHGLTLSPARVPAICVRDDQFALFEKAVDRIHRVEDALKADDTSNDPQLCGEPGRLRTSLRLLKEAVGSIQADGADATSRGWLEPIDDVLLSRFLVAADMNVERAARLIHTYAAWRRTETMGCVAPTTDWLRLGLASVPFKDKLGRPVVVIRARFMDMSASIETMERMYRSVMDVVISHLLLERPSSGEVSLSNPLEQYVLVLDTIGANRQQFSLSYLKLMVRESNEHYPDRLAKIYALGANSVVKTLWQMCAPLVHPRTRNKVSLVSTSEVGQVMRNLVDEQLLSADYGGKSPALPGTPDMASFARLAARAGSIAWSTWMRLGALQTNQSVQQMICKLPEKHPTNSTVTCSEHLMSLLEYAGVIMAGTS